MNNSSLLGFLDVLLIDPNKLIADSYSAAHLRMVYDLNICPDYSIDPIDRLIVLGDIKDGVSFPVGPLDPCFVNKLFLEISNKKQEMLTCYHDYIQERHDNYLKNGFYSDALLFISDV